MLQRFEVAKAWIFYARVNSSASSDRTLREIRSSLANIPQLNIAAASEYNLRQLLRRFLARAAKTRTLIDILSRPVPFWDSRTLTIASSQRFSTGHFVEYEIRLIRAIGRYVHPSRSR